MTARLLDVHPDAYHNLPGLSASIAKTLIQRSPLHAWHEHPCLGGEKRDPTKAQDRGQIGHKLVLCKGREIEVLNEKFEDYKTKDARSARDAARAANKIPCLAGDYADAQTMAAAITKNLAACGIVLDASSEVAFEWTEESMHGPVMCRGMADHLWLDIGWILDLKIVSNAAPDAIERSAENFGYAIQRAAYTRALEQLRPELAGRTKFLFAFCEAEAPYAVNVVEPDGLFRELGDRRWRRAVDLWAECVAANTWPAWGTSINRISAPQWALKREMEDEVFSG